jgi:colicin import membrane protein
MTTRGGAATATAAEHGGSDDPEVQAAVLKARLAQARLELHEALRIKQEAEQAHAEERAAKKRLEELIDSRSQGELARAQALFAEAEAMRRDLEEARRRAEAEAERIQDVLKEARRLKREAEAARIAAEQEVTRLKRTEDTAHRDREIIDGQIRLWEQRVVRAQARENAAARAQDIAEGASRTTVADLERQRETEARLRSQIDAEIAKWRREQDAFDNSPDQLELTARLDRQIEAAKQMAKAARRATLAHDEKLQRRSLRPGPSGLLRGP